MARRTAFQRSHHPIKVVERKCRNTEISEDGLCTSCSRELNRRVAHLPNRTGELGWTEHYSDGSTFDCTDANRKW
jgi:hypothetical protein